MKHDTGPSLSSTNRHSPSRRRKMRIIRILRLTILAMCLLVLTSFGVLVYLLLSPAKPNSTSPSDVLSSASSSNSAEQGASNSSSGTSDTSGSGTESTLPLTPIDITERLPHSDLIEAYFGPLPEVAAVMPLERRVVRGIYIGAAGNLDANIDLANSSEINAFVIDLKESYGIPYNSQNPLALEIDQVHPTYDLSAVVEQCHANDIWVIGRIVCFKDPGLATAHPEFSIQDADGNALKFKNEGGYPFVSPYNSDAWNYYIDLALEAVDMGVDEIQFDYIRFPTGGTLSGASSYFGASETTPSKADAINRFLQTARRRIQDARGIPLSADVFGIVLSSNLDGATLGQNWETIGLTGIDSLCPMIYPSHYALGTMLYGKTFDKPDLYPYDMLYAALNTGSEKASVEGYAVVRPYLQAFTASYIGEGNYMTYGYTEINQQIQAIYDTGYEEWILWNPSARYPTGEYKGTT